MGAGKTTVGQILAEKLGVPFFDLDSIIESNAQKSIGEIFGDSGEKCFRNIESRTLKHTVNSAETFVISTGGGIVLDMKNRDFMERNGITVYLKAEIDNIWKRISGDSSRPLLNTGNPLSRAKELLAQRRSLYEESLYTVNTDELSPEEVASKIMETISENN